MSGPIFEIITEDDKFLIYENGQVERFDAISGSLKEEKLLVINRIPQLVRKIEALKPQF